MLAQHLDRLERSNFCDLKKKHSSMPERKERLSPTSKASREACRNIFMKKSRMPDKVESLREVDHSKNHLRT